jgi:hypothetical protein
MFLSSRVIIICSYLEETKMMQHMTRLSATTIIDLGESEAALMNSCLILLKMERFDFW